MSRTVPCAAEDRAFAVWLVGDIGLPRAAKALGLSELTTLSIVAGRQVYSKTAQKLNDARFRIKTGLVVVGARGNPLARNRRLAVSE